jgi:hypothetical protein
VRRSGLCARTLEAIGAAEAAHFCRIRFWKLLRLIESGERFAMDGHDSAINLPFPPSTNRLWRVVDGRAICSKPYRDWIEPPEWN